MAEETISLKKSTYNKILVGIVVLAVAASFASGFIVGGGNLEITGKAVAPTGLPSAPAPAAAPTPQLPAAPEGRVQVSLDDDSVKGDENAKVTIIEFSDFQCPFCSRFYEQTLPQIQSGYIDTGKVKFAYRDFPLDSIHQQAVPGALAAECAKEQNKFWEFHDKIFANQASMSDANYKAWAKELGLDEAQFNNCYDTQKYSEEVQKDFQDGVTAGVSGTPTFFIGSPEKGYIRIVGAQPWNAIQPLIEQELAN